MLATSIWGDAAAWLGLPVAYAVTGLGVGLLLERAVAVRLPSAALLPLGMSGSICALLAVYKLGGHGLLPVALLIGLSGAGFVPARRELRDRLRPGAAGAAALGVLALYLAPTVLSGHWSWNGYNFLNDTAVQLLLADLLQHHGVGLVQGDFSTRSESIRIYLESAYPLGTHAHLAALSTLLGVGVDVAYQSYIALVAATAAVALSALARRSGLSPWRAALAGSAALAASLIYHYGMQGSIKELSAFACLATAAMLGRELLAAERPVRAAVLLGVAAAGAINVFSAAAGPYLVALVLALLGAVFLQARPLVGRLPAIAAAGALTVAVAALPTLTSALTFAGAANDALSAGSTLASTLGQLTRPLEPIQVAGVWLAEDYAMPIGQPRAEALTTGLSILVLVLAVIAVVLFLRRRESGPLLIALAAVAAAVAVAPRASPYADAKLLALASPAVVFAAMCGALTWRGRFGIPGAAAAAIAAVAVLSSSAYAYHGTRVAPVGRLQALGQMIDRVRDRGWIMLDEVEEFGKYYGRHAPRLNVAFEAITPRQAEPFGFGYHIDIDGLEQEYVQSFDTLVVRRGPATSRPPSNYRRVGVNRWYEAWAKVPGAPALPHYARQEPLDLGAAAPCEDIRSLADAAGDGGRLIVAPAPETARLDVVDAPRRPAGWHPLPAPPGVVEPLTPGVLERTVTLRGGTYDAWVRASTGRAIRVAVDGRPVGSAKGLNSQGQWLPAGTVVLPPGRHVLRMERPGGDLAPGDGVKSVLGPVALVRRESRALRTVAPSRASSLCGQRVDWIEVETR